MVIRHPAPPGGGQQRHAAYIRWPRLAPKGFPALVPSRPPSTGIRCTPTWATPPPARPAATGPTWTAGCGTRSRCP